MDIADRGIIEASKGSSAIVGDAIPASSAEHSASARGVAAWVGGWLTGESFVAIESPFPNVSVDVEDTEVVWGEGADG
jgi:hypothetical protein